MVPPSSTNSSIDRTVCHLCGYQGRTKSISIEKNGYSFLRHLPPAPGALPVNHNTHYVRACHLCVLLLDKQRELNHTSTKFFFKGFFRSIDSCHTNIGLASKIIDEEEPSPGKRKISMYTSIHLSIQIISHESSPQPSATETARSMPPPSRKTNLSTNPCVFSSFNQTSWHALFTIKKSI